MRKRENKVVITFHTTTEAMAMEQSCKETNVPGRLIPVPVQISAGCGMAWCAPVSHEGAIRNHMKENSLVWQDIGVYEI